MSGKISEWKGSERGRDFGMVKGGYEMEGFSGQRMTSERLDVTEDQDRL